MTGWDTRAQIGLRAPRGINTNINPTHGVVFHYAGGGTHRRSAHSGCRALWRAYQDWHLHPTNANNYSDIAYNLGVCVHDIILEGRSTRSRPRVRGGANGNATVNGNRYSICAIWGANDGAPPDSLKRAYLAARAFLRAQGGAGSGIAGHRDMQSTGCPGQPIYNWIRAGAPAPSASSPPQTDPPPPPRSWFEMATKKDLAEVVDERLNNTIIKHTTKNNAWHQRTLESRTANIRADQAAIREQNAAILAAVSGLDAAAVLAKLDAHHADYLARFEAAEGQREELLGLVERQQSGELAAEDFVDAVARRLARPADPSS